MLQQLRISTPAEALKVLPVVNSILNQVQTVLARSARNDVFANSRAKVMEKIQSGEMKPATLPEPEAPVEEDQPIEMPSDLPFEDEEVSQEDAEKARAELLGTTDKPKKKSKKKA